MGGIHVHTLPVLRRRQSQHQQRVSETSELSVIFVNPHTVEEENLYFVALTEVYI